MLSNRQKRWVWGFEHAPPTGWIPRVLNLGNHSLSSVSRLQWERTYSLNMMVFLAHTSSLQCSHIILFYVHWNLHSHFQCRHGTKPYDWSDLWTSLRELWHCVTAKDRDIYTVAKLVNIFFIVVNGTFIILLISALAKLWLMLRLNAVKRSMHVGL